MAARGTNQPDAAAWSAALKHRPHYEKSLGEYFALYEVRERGIKKWLEEVREKWIAMGCPAGGPDFPPLDEPARMLSWWLRNKKHSPSAQLILLAGAESSSDQADSAAVSSAVGTRSGSTSRSSPAGSSAHANSPRAAVVIASLDPTSFAAAVEQQGRYVTAAFSAYDAAAARGAPVAELSLLAGERDSALEKLRTCQRDLSAAELKSGDRPHLTDIRAELAPLLTHLASSLIDLLTARVGVPRMRARILADEWFASLRASRFGSVLPMMAPRSFQPEESNPVSPPGSALGAESSSSSPVATRPAG